jgi:hypothetical protein
MRNRIGILPALLLICAPALTAQENIFKIDLVPSGTMISLNEPVIKGDAYVFSSWPDGAPASIKRMRVQKITRVTGRKHEPIYQVDLIPSGVVFARDNPTLKGNKYVFQTWRDGRVMSLRQSDVRKITTLTGEKAFWAEQEAQGAVAVGGLAMEGGAAAVEIGAARAQSGGGSSQGGPSSLSSAGGNSQISGAQPGNWLYQGVPGASDAWAPASATVAAPGDVPRLPAATDGTSAPH